MSDCCEYCGTEDRYGHTAVCVMNEVIELRAALSDLADEVESRLFPFGECTMKSRESAWPVLIRACLLLGRTHVGSINPQQLIKGEREP